MKKVIVLTLTAAMVLSSAGFTTASEVSENYTQVKTFDGTYGFGDAEITVATDDDFSAFYITFECFDEEQILEGTVVDGVVTVDYDLTGFVSGDAQQMWDDAQTSENAWESTGTESVDASKIEETSGYTQMKTYDGTYGFGDAEITVSTNDDFSAFYITFECFDEEQILEGTVTDGVVTVDYDLTGFVSGDAQQMWDDAQASENAWEPIAAGSSDQATATETDDAASEYDFENWTTIVTEDVFDQPIVWEQLPEGYNTYDNHKQGTVLRLHYTTDAYEDGKTYEKYCTVYLPYGYDENDTETKYNVIYFQHGNSGSPNEFWDHIMKSANCNNLFANMFDESTQVLEKCIIICPTFYFETDENEYTTVSDSPAGDGRYEGIAANYYDEIIDDLIPQIESRFNVYCDDFSHEGIKASRDHRAWAGYSRGSMCTWEVMHSDFEYFKYWMPCSGDIRILEEQQIDLEETSGSDAKAAFNYIKEAIDAHPDLDFYLMCYIGGSADQKMISEYVSQMQYFYSQTDTFSYGTDPEENNFYFVISDYAHNDLYFPFILANTRNFLFK